MSKDMLSITGLQKQFGDKYVLNGLNLNVPEQSIFGFIGKNGAGKTTTMKMILGLLSPDSGEIIVNGDAFRLIRPFSSEMGHMKITDRNVRCGCGEYGCFESVASTIALERQTREAMLKNKDSKMWEKYTLESVNGRTVFEFKDVDKTAAQVFKNYIKYLGTGIVNLINILSPEAVIIGGAVSAQKEALTAPLKEYVYSHIYTRNERPLPEILTAKASGNAGIPPEAAAL